MEQTKEVLPTPKNGNEKLRELYERASEIRMMQLMFMKDLETKYKSFETTSNINSSVK
jgi:hypothetical protein